MPKQDIYHEVVKNARITDGWTITPDPLVLAVGRRDMYVDLGAEQPMGAEQEGPRMSRSGAFYLAITEGTDASIFCEPLGQLVLAECSLQVRQTTAGSAYPGSRDRPPLDRHGPGTVKRE